MEVVAAAPRCQLLLSILMAAMLLPGMKGSPLLVQRKYARTIKLQESIGKGSPTDCSYKFSLPMYSMAHKRACGEKVDGFIPIPTHLLVDITLHTTNIDAEAFSNALFSGIFYLVLTFTILLKYSNCLSSP
ncbi:hypothetical protein STEG23_023899 [Scotinomys teguina]